jgi:hypothetical protein
MMTPDIDLLRRLYVDEQMTIVEVAASLGVAPQTVHNRLVAAEIARRPRPSTPRSDIIDDEIRRQPGPLTVSSCMPGCRVTASSPRTTSRQFLSLKRRVESTNTGLVRSWLSP